MNEEWRDIKGYEGLYQVSNLGRVRSKRGILKPRITPKGYLRIQLSKGGDRKDKFVHVLVAETFLCKYDSTLQVNHIDGDKTNNKVSNLEWCTCSENIKHAFKTGLKKPTKYFKGKHTYHNMKKVECIETGKKFNSIREAAQYYNCDENKIGMVCRGQRKSCGKYKNIKLTWRYIYMNKILLTGRLVKDAEMSFLPGTGMPKIAFTIAVDRAYQKDKNNKKVDFIACEQIGKHTEKLAQYLTKGKMIGVEGELNIDQYEKDGVKKSFTKVKVDRLEFLGGGKQEEHDPTGKFKEVLDDDELPF